MQSFEFQRTIERFFGESEKFQPFITVVSELAKAADGMTDFIKGFRSVEAHKTMVQHTSTTILHEYTKQPPA